MGYYDLNTEKEGHEMDARPTSFGSADAKARFSELLARAEAGETITIQRHGKAVAKLIPARDAMSVEEKRRRLDAYIEWQRKHGPRLQPGDDIKAWINEGRP
jgi:prevent-host-death family protein